MRIDPITLNIVTIARGFLGKKINYITIISVLIYLATDNRKLWKAVTPPFFEKYFCTKKITLLEGGEIILEDAEVARKFNNYFSKVVDNLNIEGFET